MKFSIRQSALLDLIQTVSKAVAVRTTKQVLSGILLEVTSTHLTATAYDMELGIQITVIADENNQLDIADIGSIVLPARYFTDVVRKLPGETVSIQVQGNYMTELRSAAAEFHLHGIDAAEFPKLPSFERSRSIAIPGNILASLIRSTVFATSPVEVRPILTGVHVQFVDSHLIFTATDALRLAKKQANLESLDDAEPWSAVLPSKSLNELVKLLPDSETPITLQFFDGHSLFEVGSTLFYSRLIEGTYPDTTRIIPTSHKTELSFDASLLHGAIDRASLIARDREVRLEISDAGVLLTSNSPDIGNLSERIELLAKEGDNLTISFNAKYVLDALRPLEMDVVRIFFNGWNQPFVIRQENDESVLQLISPVLMR